jgi:hypothetical protein
MSVDIEERRAVRLFPNHVRIPDFLEQRRSGHVSISSR